MKAVNWNGCNRTPWKATSKEYPYFLNYIALEVGNGNIYVTGRINGGAIFCCVRNSPICTDYAFLEMSQFFQLNFFLISTLQELELELGLEVHFERDLSNGEAEELATLILRIENMKLIFHIQELSGKLNRRKEKYEIYTFNIYDLLENLLPYLKLNQYRY